MGVSFDRDIHAGFLTEHRNVHITFYDVGISYRLFLSIKRAIGDLVGFKPTQHVTHYKARVMWRTTENALKPDSVDRYFRLPFAVSGLDIYLTTDTVSLSVVSRVAKVIRFL